MLTVDSDICLPFQRLRETIFDVPPYRKQSSIKYRTLFCWLKAKRKYKTVDSKVRKIYLDAKTENNPVLNTEMFSVG